MTAQSAVQVGGDQNKWSGVDWYTDRKNKTEKDIVAPCLLDG